MIFVHKLDKQDVTTGFMCNVISKVMKPGLVRQRHLSVEDLCHWGPCRIIHYNQKASTKKEALWRSAILYVCVGERGCNFLRSSVKAVNNSKWEHCLIRHLTLSKIISYWVLLPGDANNQRQTSPAARRHWENINRKIKLFVRFKQAFLLAEIWRVLFFPWTNRYQVNSVL